MASDSTVGPLDGRTAFDAPSFSDAISTLADAGSEGGGEDAPGPYDAPEAAADAGVADTGAGDESEASTGPVSDPGAVQCGGMPCATPSNFCCVQTDGGFGTAPGEGMCESTQMANQCTGFRVECDEAADCLAGDVCCAAPSSVAPFPTVCLAGSPGVCVFNGGPQLCKTDSECTPAATCTLKVCSGQAFFSCGPLPSWFTCP